MQQLTLENEPELDFKIREATQVIKQAIQKSRSTPIILNFSGGKDSLTLLDLTQKVTDNFVCFYMDSGIEFPEAIEFATAQCKRHQVKLLTSHPTDYKGSFFDRLPIIGYFPTVQNNTLWCNRDLKIRPQHVVLKRTFGKQTFFKLNGVRRFESSRRMKIHRNTKNFMRKDYHVSNSIMVFPILNWTSKDVLDYLRLNSVRIATNPLYAKYSVSGCYYCPFYQRHIYIKILKQEPNIFDEIIKWEEKLNSPSACGHIWLRDLKQALSDKGEI